VFYVSRPASAFWGRHEPSHFQAFVADGSTLFIVRCFPTSPARTAHPVSRVFVSVEPVGARMNHADLGITHSR